MIGGVQYLKSALELFNQYRHQSKKKNNTSKSMVQRASFKDSNDFAGDNKIVQKMYERSQKRNK
jgi:hypothetical protein